MRGNGVHWRMFEAPWRRGSQGGAGGEDKMPALTSPTGNYNSFAVGIEYEAVWVDILKKCSRWANTSHWNILRNYTKERLRKSRWENNRKVPNNNIQLKHMSNHQLRQLLSRCRSNTLVCQGGETEAGIRSGTGRRRDMEESGEKGGRK